MARVEYVSIAEARVIRTTDKAVLILTAGGDESWIPFSEISVPTLSDCQEGNLIEDFKLSPWIAEKKGLDYE